MWSAIKVMQELPGYMGYCIMGTYLSPEHVLEINRLTKNWWLCLDKDATHKSIGYLQKYRHLGQFRVGALKQDMKYMDRDEMMEVIQ